MLVKNRSWTPRILVIPAKEKGKKARSVVFKARGSAEIDEETLKHPECQRLIEARELIVIPEPAKQAKKAKAPKES